MVVARRREMSQRVSGYSGGDKFYTPPWVVDELMIKESFKTPIWEPAAGDGHITDVIDKYYGTQAVFASDIAWEGGENFLEPDTLTDCQTIITNPPYSLAVPFIEKALELTKPIKGKVAMLLPVNFDCAKRRVHLFRNCPAFRQKWILLRRIRWENIDQKQNAPSSNHAWYVWDWSNYKEPTIGYIE